ncbi:MAG TPA: hypothetical protein VG937_23075 [Polyangiaceae bacterium]|nr:hypothetical protein [Polyangiaceae bacterium]
MNERLLTEDPLVEIEALRRQSPASALSRLNDAPPELFARPEARLTQAELVHELRGPAAARPLLVRLVAEFPNYGSAFHRLARVHDELEDRVAALECRLAVHRLDAILDDALEPCDEAVIDDDLSQTALEALSVAPGWVRGRLTPVPLAWCGRPELQRVEQGFDPRALAELREVRASVVSPSSPRASLLTLVLYRTNLLASADDEKGLRQNLRVAIRELLERMA